MKRSEARFELTFQSCAMKDSWLANIPISDVTIYYLE